MEKENEWQLKKPENIYTEEQNENQGKLEEQPIESQEQIDQAIESELNSSESKQQQLDQNIEALGGEEGVKKLWSEMDQNKKEEINERIEEYINDKKAYNKDAKLSLLGAGLGITLTAAGVFGVLFPQALPGGEVMGLSGMDRSELVALTFTAGGLFTGGFFSTLAIKDKFKSIQSAFAAKTEKKKLKNLEQKYQ